MDTLNVQVRRIDGDLAELLFNPREVDLRVGETLTQVFDVADAEGISTEAAAERLVSWRLAATRG